MNIKQYPKIQDWNKYRSLRTRLDIQAQERDGNKCGRCKGIIGLEVHHKVRGIEELGNLITLCHSCHKKKHNMSGCFKKGKDPRRKLGTKEFYSMIGKRGRASQLSGASSSEEIHAR